MTGFNEAGAVMPRKCAAYVWAARKAQQASMRPGLLCPGRMIRAAWHICHRRFNEAGAVMPRKRRHFLQRRPGSRGFNEAGAVMPRKLLDRPPLGAARGASMRPGLLCPGRDFDGQAGKYLLVLQ